MKPLTPPSRPAFAARPTPIVPPTPPDRQRLVVLVLAGLLCVAVIACVYLWMQLKQTGNVPEATEQAEVLELVEEVGRLIVLPEGEIPTVATVQDPAVLQDQPFFARAKTGDKVLLYTAARKAILYDPVLKKIVEVAPINVGDATPEPVEPAPEE